MVRKVFISLKLSTHDIPLCWFLRENIVKYFFIFYKGKSSFHSLYSIFGMSFSQFVCYFHLEFEKYEWSYYLITFCIWSIHILDISQSFDNAKIAYCFYLVVWITFILDVARTNGKSKAKNTKFLFSSIL